MLKHPLLRIGKDEKLRNMLLSFCRFKAEDIWEDELSSHKIACPDASKKEEIKISFNSRSRIILITIDIVCC